MIGKTWEMALKNKSYEIRVDESIGLSTIQALMEEGGNIQMDCDDMSTLTQGIDFHERHNKFNLTKNKSFSREPRFFETCHLNSYALDKQDFKNEPIVDAKKYDNIE